MEQRLQRKSSRSVAGSRIAKSREGAAGEVVIGATEVVGDVAKVEMSSKVAGDLEVKVRGMAEAIHVFRADLISLIPESMQEAGWK